MTFPGPDKDDPIISDTDRRFVERQIRLHVDLAQWRPDPHAADATPENWRRAFEIAYLLKEGVRDDAEIARRLSTEQSEVEADRRLVPYLDRTVAGLLAVLGWYVNTQAL